MKVIFSYIDEDDLVACSELYAKTFREPPWNEEWSTENAFERLSDFLSCPKSIAIKAIYDDEIRGFIFGEIEPYNGDKYYNLKEICVSATLQRKGVGKGLMKKLGKILEEDGVSKIYLITQRNSIPSSFYASLGFSEVKKMMLMGKLVK